MNPDDPAKTDRPAEGSRLEAVNDTRVATGHRRDEVRLEPDPDQLVRMRTTFKPDRPLPLEDHARPIDPGNGSAPPVEDVVVVKPGPSVWDARPAGPDGSGAPRGR